MKTIRKETKYDRLNKRNLVALPLKGQNFGLSKSEFVEMIVSLKDGREDLFERIFLSHFENCIQYLIKNFKVEREQAYDISMETLIQFRKKLLTDKISYGNLRYLFTKMAGQNIIKKSQKKEKRDLTGFYLLDDDIQYEEKAFEALEEAWDTLDCEKKIILESYYYNKTPLIKLATKLGITDTTMRKKKQRSVEKLRELFFNIYNS